VSVFSWVQYAILRLSGKMAAWRACMVRAPQQRSVPVLYLFDHY
jgi:hypothetical protein